MGVLVLMTSRETTYPVPVYGCCIELVLFYSSSLLLFLLFSSIVPIVFYCSEIVWAIVTLIYHRLNCLFSCFVAVALLASAIYFTLQSWTCVHIANNPRLKSKKQYWKNCFSWQLFWTTTPRKFMHEKGVWYLMIYIIPVNSQDQILVTTTIKYNIYW